jgi:hypothetical protein
MTASQAFLIRRDNAIDRAPTTLSGGSIKREIREAYERFNAARGIAPKTMADGIIFGKGRKI